MSFPDVYNGDAENLMDMVMLRIWWKFVILFERKRSCISLSGLISDD